ncbi:MAG: hypothetical protein WBP08_07410 [Saprospiraceae bacterium]|jgi:predicted RNase H-like nuclease (RuvC/YqgF family)|nr:hypothetical protein [Saprospiraceae bacterium]
MKNMIQNLNIILEKVRDVRKKYQDLKQRNQELEVRFSDLKVEADIYKLEIINLKKELEGKTESTKHSMLSNTNNSSDELLEKLKLEQNSKNSRLQLQLDEFIEDIDQCIQIIQSKE